MARRLLTGLRPSFADRCDAGRRLAAALELELERGPGLVVVGLARGGVEVAAEVARCLGAPLDVVSVRKVGHPLQPEYGIGAVTPGGVTYLRGPDGLDAEQLAAVVEQTRAEAAALDRELHAGRPAADLAGATAILVDDGLATGATMIAAVRWARAAGASRVVAAVPVAAASSLEPVRSEADAVVCLYASDRFFAVGAWYASFEQVDTGTVIGLIDENRTRLDEAHAPSGR